MINNTLTFVTAIILATSAIAGGDDRDTDPVEALELIAPSLETPIGNQNPETMKLTIAGKDVSIVAHIACQDKLGLKESNITIFKKAQIAGNLYNTGPIENLGTEFSPDRWDAYFECVAKQ